MTWLKHLLACCSCMCHEAWPGQDVFSDAVSGCYVSCAFSEGKLQNKHHLLYYINFGQAVFLGFPVPWLFTCPSWWNCSLAALPTDTVWLLPVSQRRIIMLDMSKCPLAVETSSILGNISVEIACELCRANSDLALKLIALVLNWGFTT